MAGILGWAIVATAAACLIRSRLARRNAAPEDAKGAVAERIPPRTARWKDEYFVCAACQRLFWRGTHWERIAARLKAVAEEGRP